MAESPLSDLLGRLEKLIDGNRELAVRGFGILLLRRWFGREDAEEIKDPTDAIIGKKLGGLGSDEMIPDV